MKLYDCHWTSDTNLFSVSLETQHSGGMRRLLLVVASPDRNTSPTETKPCSQITTGNATHSTHLTPGGGGGPLYRRTGVSVRRVSVLVR